MLTRHVFDQLAAYAEQQLDDRAAARVETHVRTCEKCRVALEEIRRGIALASELEAETMPDDVAARIRQEILHAQRQASASYALWWRVAAAMIVVLAGVATYWQLNRPWARLHEADAAASPFERQGRELHDRLKRGDVKLQHAAADEREVWRWLASQHAPVTSLRPTRAATDRTRFVPLGASVRELGHARTSVIAYRIDGRPVTLMLALERDVAEAPSPGWWSKRVTHRQDAGGINTLTWTVAGGTYVLVSELDDYGQEACFICHTDEKFKEPIMRLHPRRSTRFAAPPADRRAWLDAPEPHTP